MAAPPQPLCPLLLCVPEKRATVPCTLPGCRCQGFTFIPSHPEEVGEFWLRRRTGFDPAAWRAKCRCKHTHEEHAATGARACGTRGGCGHGLQTRGASVGEEGVRLTPRAL